MSLIRSLEIFSSHPSEQIFEAGLVSGVYWPMNLIADLWPKSSMRSVKDIQLFLITHERQTTEPSGRDITNLYEFWGGPNLSSGEPLENAEHSSDLHTNWNLLAVTERMPWPGWMRLGSRGGVICRWQLPSTTLAKVVTTASVISCLAILMQNRLKG